MTRKTTLQKTKKQYIKENIPKKFQNVPENSLEKEVKTLY